MTPGAGPGRLALGAALVALVGLGGQSQWSPETATFAYTSSATGNAEIVVRDGRGPAVVISRSEAADHWANWSPDGDRIAFQTRRDGNFEVYVMGADGSDQHNVTQHEANDLLPEFSLDGKQLLFFSDRGEERGPRGELRGNLYVVDLDGGEPRRLTSTTISSTFGGAWSPDGTRVLFARDFDGDIDLVQIDVSSGTESRLPGTSASEYGGRYSPDGEWIAFHAAGPDGESRIVICRIDGTDRRELTSGAQHYDPRFSPDGNWIAFTGAPLGESQFDVLMVAAAGGPVEVLIATQADERTASWRPILEALPIR